MNLAPVIPLQLDDQNGYAMTTDVKKLIAFHLKNLLLTSKGEKISDPNYGVGLKRYLFEPLTMATSNEIKDQIQNQISRYLSYINVANIMVIDSEEDYSLSVKISYNISGTGVAETTTINADGSTSTPSGGIY